MYLFLFMGIGLLCVRLGDMSRRYCVVGDLNNLK